jgi:3-dehydrotetronate 4-kinase
MLLGIIADDLTGATDVAVNLRAAGLSVVQINGVPRADLDPGEVEAVVVALKSRTIPAAEACAVSLASLEWLRRHGAERIYFKYCSTFDSTAAGNIGPVTDALADALDAAIVPATPAYPRNQRTVYQGHLFVGDVLLSETGMRNHPLTPMTDANLVRVLQAQTLRRVGLVALSDVERGATAIRQRVDELRAAGCRHAILDATAQTHLESLGSAVLDFPLTTGGAGLASGIAAQLRPRSRDGRVNLRRVEGPLAILAGSCSSATLEQLAALPASWQARRLDVAALLDGVGEAAQAVDWALARLGQAPIVISASVSPDELARIQQRYGRERSAEAIESAFRQIATALARHGVRRFVVAGGETSGAVVAALAGELGFQALAIGAEIAPGVPWTVSVDGEPVALALKSGNFGGRDFFVRAEGVEP